VVEGVGSEFPTSGLLRALNGPPPATCGKLVKAAVLGRQRKRWWELAFGEFRCRPGSCEGGSEDNGSPA